MIGSYKPFEPVWCLSMLEPIVALSEYWHDDSPWRRVWHNYVALPHGCWRLAP